MFLPEGGGLKEVGGSETLRPATLPDPPFGSALPLKGGGKALNPHHRPQQLLVAGAAGEVIEGPLGDPDDVVLDEGRAFGGAVLWMLQAALPFQHRPGIVIVLGELGEDAAEIHLAVAEGTEAPCPAHPALIAGIDALPPRRVELGGLDMEGLDPLVVDVDELEIVELLQKEVRRIVIDVAALVAADRVEEHLEGRAVEHVLARMDLVADIDAVLVIDIEDRLPALAELREGLLDQPWRTLRPRIEIWEGERAAEGH